jgi:exodeoxyribonuclease V alpha subunit
MTTHFTVRMIWHDSKWDGNICKDPRGNFYCTGSHSLLSDRIARNKKDELEAEHAGQTIDGLEPTYTTPCYWTTAAFSNTAHKITHRHPFGKYADKTIAETLQPYSVFSWPFRLSFNHSSRKRKGQGSYPKDLPERIRSFLSRFEPQESLVFFYLNYDNPVSGDEEQYALVGCAVVRSSPNYPPDFSFSPTELKTAQSGKNMQHFPTVNWAVQIPFDFEASGIRLPYHEYLEHIAQNPEDSRLLEEIRVLIEEKSLIFGFKYVLADVDEDQAIYLLTKIRKAVDRIQEHGIVDFAKQQKLVNELLEKAWKRRGLYPGLGTILDFVLEEGEKVGSQIVQLIAANCKVGEDLCEKTFDIVSKISDPVPVYLKEHGDAVLKIRKNFTQHTSQSELLKKLSLFLIRPKQLRNIILQDKTAFSKEIDHNEIVRNPYLLSEEYRFETTDEELDKEELDDGPIDLFKIDIGMFPEKYLRANNRLQNLAAGSAERLRAIIREYLYSMKSTGDCFATLEDVYDNIMKYPLFYKRELSLSKDQLLAPEYVKHFEEKLSLRINEGKTYFYLKEVRHAENIIKNVVESLIRRADTQTQIPDITGYVQSQVEELRHKAIQGFDEKQFVSERTKLLGNILQKSFYVISGKPGSGKTRVLRKIISELERNHEKATILAPTGKASIRLKTECGAKDAQTIDKFIYGSPGDWRRILSDFTLILGSHEGKPPIENLIIDESSMVDLQKLATIFSMLTLEGGGKIKRLIMVGDENQLPPIGFGKPFYDIIDFLRTNPQYMAEHYIRLLTNCRQEADIRPKIFPL